HGARHDRAPTGADAVTRRLIRPLRGLAVLAALGGALWLGGLVWFVYSSLSSAGDRNMHTDAIVVLTGGRMRLETGVDLLGQGKARKLFISGVNQRVDRGALMRVFGPVADRAQCCIVLGYDSDDTFGNARETAAWMRQQHFSSLRLVTSWYHMPRGLLEFHRAMPEVTVIASPVFARGEDGDGRIAAWLGAAELTVGEYDKYLAVLLRPAAESVFPGLVWPRPLDRAEATAAVRAR
ncbi:MAG: YdcF family protein, partial [Stellaceae bacterium]